MPSPFPNPFRICQPRLKCEFPDENSHFERELPAEVRPSFVCFARRDGKRVSAQVVHGALLCGGLRGRGLGAAAGTAAGGLLEAGHCPFGWSEGWGQGQCEDLRVTGNFARGLSRIRSPSVLTTAGLLGKSQLRSQQAAEALVGSVAKGGSGAAGPGYAYTRAPHPHPAAPGL